jgi:GMP synthase (glutamine-hydrolysing)
MTKGQGPSRCEKFSRTHLFPVSRSACEVTPQRLEMARKADHIFISMIREAGLYDKIGQAFAALDLSKAARVRGDKRTYENIVLLRAVETTDS